MMICAAPVTQSRYQPGLPSQPRQTYSYFASSAWPRVVWYRQHILMNLVAVAGDPSDSRGHFQLLSLQLDWQHCIAQTFIRTQEVSLQSTAGVHLAQDPISEDGQCLLLQSTEKKILKAQSAAHRRSLWQLVAGSCLDARGFLLHR